MWGKWELSVDVVKGLLPRPHCGKAGLRCRCPLLSILAGQQGLIRNGHSSPPKWE